MVSGALRSPGAALSPTRRAPLESAFGADFSRVRIHSGSAARASARSLGARAYTWGQSVVLGPGESVESDGGRLLAHELAHVVQQRGGDGAPTGASTIGVGPSDGPAEREADRAAEAAMRGSAAHVTTRSARVVRRETASQAISNHTHYLDLDEPALGRRVARAVRSADFTFATAVLDELGSTDRDDVSYEAMLVLTDAELDTAQSTAAGRRFLSRMLDELSSGTMASEEEAQTERILAARTRGIGETALQDAAAAGDIKVFPYRAPGLTQFSPAPMFAQLRPNDRIHVEQPVAVLGTTEFRNETQTLPTRTFTSGIELPQDEIVGVRMYDLGGEIIFRPAIVLMRIANATDAAALEAIAVAVGIGLTLGSGELVALGYEASMAARVLLWADRAAFAIGLVTQTLRDHRGWILSTFGERGRTFLWYVDLVNSAVAIYGVARVVVAAGQLVQGLRQAWGRWRGARGGQSLTSQQRTAVGEIDDQLEQMFARVDELDEARGATRATGETDAPPAAARETPPAAEGPAAPAPRPASPFGDLVAERPVTINGEPHFLRIYREADGTHTLRLCTECDPILDAIAEAFPSASSAERDVLRDLRERAEDLQNDLDQGVVERPEFDELLAGIEQELGALGVHVDAPAGDFHFAMDAQRAVAAGHLDEGGNLFPLLEHIEDRCRTAPPSTADEAVDRIHRALEDLGANWRLDFGNNIQTEANGTLYHLRSGTFTFVGETGEIWVRRHGHLLFHFLPN